MEALIELIEKLIEWVRSLLEWMLDHFLALNVFEKILVITMIPAFLAVIQPVARYYIFDTWFYINNPLAVYMIGIVALFFGTYFLPPLWSVILRSATTLYYLAWVIYLQVSHGFSRAPYELTGWFWLNIAVPVCFIILALVSYLVFERNRLV